MKMLTRLLDWYLQRKKYIKDILYGEIELSFDDKKQISHLTSFDEFRKFEKYLQVKQRTRARRLLHCKEEEMSLLRRDVSMIAEITADMARFWNEVHSEDVSKKIKEKKVKLFGSRRLKL